MSPRPSPLSYIRRLHHLETYLGATKEHILELVRQVAAGDGYVQYVQSKNGKRRVITFVTDEELRRVHGRILDLLAPLAEDLPPNIHAFARGRSTRSNALEHIGAFFTQTFDLADFFTQVRGPMVIDGLTHYGVVAEVAEVLAGLTTVAGSLPMGFMTSPMLANTSLHRFDAELLSLATEHGLVVSRYADDIVFSSAEAFDMTAALNQVARRHELRINQSKSRSSRRGQRMLITGLSIATGDRPRLPRSYRARIRQELHYITAYGLEGHADRLQASESYIGKRLGGRLAYAESVDRDWVNAVAAKYPEAYKAVALSGSPRSAAKRTESLMRLSARVREHQPVGLPPYVSTAQYYTR